MWTCVYRIITHIFIHVNVYVHILQIPDELCSSHLTDGNRYTVKGLIEYVFGDNPPVLPARPSSSASGEVRRRYALQVKSISDFYVGRAVLAPTNKVVRAVNTAIIEKMCGECHVFKSADSVLPTRMGTCTT